MRPSLFLLFAFNARRLLRNYWSDHVVIPCPHVQWTCEHIIPKSLIMEHNDLHNLLFLPDRLNNVRSNFPYTDIDQEQSTDPHRIVLPCHNCSCGNHGIFHTPRSMTPPDPFKGMIARSILCMRDKYPHHRQLIETRVLALSTALEWDMEFAATLDELVWDELICDAQGDNNPYTLLSFNGKSRKWESHR